MNYREIEPTDVLKDYIKFFWVYENLDEDIEHTILPDACFDLLADFQDGVLQDVILTGIWTQPISVTETKGTTLLALRFKLPAADVLFAKEIKSNLNTMCSLPLSFWNINQFKSPDFNAFIATLQNQFKKQLEQLDRIDTRKLKLFDAIYHDKAQSVKALSEQIAWSSRQINRYLDKQFGISAKTLLQICRCNAAYKDLANGQLYPSNTHVDQSHFIKEVKKYTWTTPRDLSKNKNDRFLQLSVEKDN